MIKSLRLTNFKCFPSVEAELGTVTVLAGANGTGKSTLAQALLLYFQSRESGALVESRLDLNGRYVSLGTGQDILYRQSDHDSFVIEIKSASGSTNVRASVATSVQEHSVRAETTEVNGGAQMTVRYLSADRLGPQKSYAMNFSNIEDDNLGVRGEFAPQVYARVRTRKIANDALILETAEGERFADIETQFRLWMGDLFPGFQARVDTVYPADSVVLGMALQQQVGTPEVQRPPNVGFGLSVAFPVVLAGLMAQAGTLMIVENPEAHLHPSAQSLVGEFLVRVAGGGAQVLVETHSDHVVNGMRIAYKNRMIAPGDLRFLAFNRTTEYGSNRVSNVELTATGEFVSPPSEFFDQVDKDLRAIYDL